MTTDKQVDSIEREIAGIKQEIANLRGEWEEKKHRSSARFLQDRISYLSYELDKLMNKLDRIGG